MRKPSRLKLLLGSFIVIISTLAIINMDLLIGSFWHITHSSQVHYETLTVEIPFGWLPINRKGALGMVNYTGDESVIILKKTTVQIERDPKEVAESMGWTFKSAEYYLIDGRKGLRITNTTPGGDYRISIILPEDKLSILYTGPEKNIVAFDNIVSGITFIKSK